MNDAKAFATRLLDGDPYEAWDIVQHWIDQRKSSLAIFEELITQGMRYIGQLWENNEITVADEHLATGVCDVVLSRYAYHIQQPSKVSLRVMLFCVEKEDHYLGLKMSSILFQERGWDVKFLGPNLPLDHALYNVVKWKPDAIAISFAMMYQIPTVEQYLEQLHPHAQLLVGSRIVSMMDLSPHCPQDTLLFSNLTDLAQWMDTFTLQHADWREVK